jgi:O-antigen/teichoic acid export membrane protein
MLKLLSKSSLAKNAGWMLFGQGVGYGLKVLYFVVIARLLGVLQYGIVVGALALVSFVAQYSRLGMGTVLMRYVSGNHKRFAVFWGNILMVSVLMSGALILILRLLAYHILDAASAGVVIFTAVGSVFCEQLTTSATQAFQSHQSMRIAALLGQLTPAFRTLTAIGMLLALHHTTARVWVVASMIASAMATMVAIAAVTAKFGWPEFAPSLAMKHAGEGLEYSFAASTVSAYNDLDKTMLSHYGMAAANGIYGLAYRIVDVGTVPFVAIQLAAEPRLFQLANVGPNEQIKLGRRLLRHGVLVSTLAAIGMFLFAPVVPLIAGPGFNQVILALRWLCLIPIFRSIHGMTGSVLTSLGMQRLRTYTQITAVVINFGLNVWLIPRYGWLGAAWSSLATDGSLGALNWCVLEIHRRRQMSKLVPELV